MSAQKQAAPGQSEAQGATAAQQQQTANLPANGVLDEDDEFEEFDAQDWQDSATSLSHLAAANSKDAASAGASMSGDRAGGADHLWEDNWDDDDIEDDFSLALRAELEKQGGAQPMST